MMNDEDRPDGLIDFEAVQEIVEKAKDALRPLGLTLTLENVQLNVQQGQVWAVLPCIVRQSAKAKLDEDKASKEAFNKMMAEQHEAMIEEESSKIREWTQDPDKLAELLFGAGEVNECEHARKHPDGFCLDCGAGI